MSIIAKESISAALETLVEQLIEIRTGAAALAESKAEAGEAKSISDLRARTETALDNIGGLQIAIVQDDVAVANELGQALRGHIVSEVAGVQLVEDLKAAIAEAETDLSSRVGMHRNPFKSFIEIGGTVIATIAEAATGAAELAEKLQHWSPSFQPKEVDMAEHNEPAGILAELEGIGRQLSFLGTSVAAPRPTGSTGGAGSHRSVSAQMMASLDALALPHHGVQFTTGSAAEAARGDLIEGLLDAFREEEREGNTKFVPGPSEERRRGVRSPSQILSGASRVTGRLVRAEADNILDILDRLPDMTRFRIRQGLPSASESRRVVAERFQDLDEVMLDPMGVNLPRASFALRRIAKAILDFFDYANLERELVDQLCRRGGDRFVAQHLPRPLRDDDEIGQRRSVVQSEELRREIAELAESFMRLVARVISPQADTLGTTAARLEQTLTVVYGSAHSLRDIMVRSGSSLPEQDVQLFATGILIQVEDRWHGSGEQGGARPGRILLSTGQLLDWILEVSEPYVGAANRSALLEHGDFEILADELDGQLAAIDRVLRECQRLGFAFRLPGPMRQLEEMQFHIGAAAKLARELTDDARQPAETEGAI